MIAVANNSFSGTDTAKDIREGDKGTDSAEKKTNAAIVVIIAMIRFFSKKRLSPAVEEAAALQVFDTLGPTFEPEELTSVSQSTAERASSALADADTDPSIQTVSISD